jgi:DNA-directed RNA polymerase specialized sigma24 family protein
MARNSAIASKSFEEILTWLNPDREVAGEMYVQLRQDLTRIFVWRKCSDPEGLTDEVFDRVARKVHVVRQTYEGDPRLYFRAVANNLVKETFKKMGTHVPLDDVDLPNQSGTSADDEDIDDCLHRCLRKLNTETRRLILAYYAKEKQAKIDHRQKLAQSLDIPIETLRVKVYRIRESLEECIERCFKRKAERQGNGLHERSL